MTDEVKPESEIVKALREEYEKRLEDKDKIIKDLIKQDGKKATKKQSIIEEDEDEEDEDEDEEKKQKEIEEARRQKRMDYYKKYIH